MAKKEIGRPQTAHIPPFGLRLQPDLKERIEAASKENGRSMNAEIAARLEESFGIADAVPREQYELLEQQVELMTKAVDASRRIEFGLEGVVKSERMISAMLAKGVLGLGDKLRGVLGTLPEQDDSPVITSLRADVLNAMATARMALTRSLDTDEEIGTAMVHTTVNQLAALDPRTGLDPLAGSSEGEAGKTRKPMT